MEVTMVRTLQDFVDAAIEKGSFPKDSALLRLYVQKLVLDMHVYGTENIQRLADDIVVELEYFGHISKQPKRKSKRYFSTPIRLDTPREKYIFDLAAKCNAAYGKAISFRMKVEGGKGSHKRPRGGEQDDFASDFLAQRREDGKLLHNVSQKEFLSMIRSINAQKATPTRRKKEAAEQRIANLKREPPQETLF